MSLKPSNLNLLLGAAHEVVTSGGPSSSSLTFKVTSVYPGRPNLSVRHVYEGREESGILLRAELGNVGNATVLATATSSTGYAGLNTLDFEAWNLTPPPTFISSEVFKCS